MERERGLREKETLVFPDSERAGQFVERVGQRVREKQESSPRGVQEAVRETLAQEFEQAGYPVSPLRRPWEHTQQEHVQAQELVDLAFAQNLHAALVKAQASEDFPRILDLFHDVLTGEMYEHVRERGLNRQPIGAWFFVVGAVSVSACIACIILFFL